MTQHGSRWPQPLTAERAVPIVLGSLVILGGLALGLLGRDEPPGPIEPSAPPEAAPSAPEPVFDPPPPEDLPDLSGPDLGELIVAGASDAHGIDARDGRLVWITTDAAALTSSRYDGGDIVELHRDARADRFGGAMARDRRGLYFSVAGGDGPEPIFFVPAADLAASAKDLEPIVHGSSPDGFVATGKLFAWADLGTLRRRNPDGEVVEMARRPGRIAAVAASDDSLFWIETPYAGAGGHALMAAPLGGGEARQLAALAPAERDTLAASRAVLIWSETLDEEHRVVRLAEAEPDTVARTGLVTALVVADDRAFWAERHGDEPVSVIRSAPMATGEIRRHGRHRGPITALEVADGQLFFSGRDGLYRARLE
jgi:hypothetical protein